MQKKLYTIAILALLLLMAGCDDRLKEDVKLDVSVVSEGSYKEGDILVVKKSTDVVFNFSGKPDFISFYSGETGHAYKHRTRTLLSEDEITSELKFSSFAQYGTIPGSFKVYLSTSFGEMSLDKNKQTDSLSIINHNWIDISDLCNLPIVSATTLRDAVIPLDSYLGKRLNIAFQYKPLNNTTAQPTWEVQSLMIINKSKEDGSEASLLASTMGFTAFDMYASGQAAYQTGTTAGIWNVSNIAASPSKIRMQSSSIGADLNVDWLISKPIVINACTPDTGVGIKTITNSLNSYKYQYSKPGTYTITFVGRNSNFEASSEVVRELTIKVID